MTQFGGLQIQIIEDESLVDVTEDWSGVRSPGRARRRRARGHRQNIVIVYTPKQTVYSIDNGRAFVTHPVVAERLRQEIKRQELIKKREDLYRHTNPLLRGLWQ